MRQIHFFRSSQTLIICVRTAYPTRVSIRIGQYLPGKWVRPREGASGELGNHIPKAMMDNVVTVNGQLAQLCRKGILLVRMM